MPLLWSMGERRVLPARTRIVAHQWNWDDWLENSGRQHAPEPVPTPAYFLLYQRHNRMQYRRITPFTALILQHIGPATSLPQMVSGIQNSLADTEAVDRHQLRQKIMRQLENAYQAGFVTCMKREVMESAPALEHG